MARSSPAGPPASRPAARPAWLRLRRAHVGEHDAGHLLHRVGGVAQGVLHHRLRWLEGLLQARAGRVIEPAVVGAADAAILKKAVVERGPSVGALLPDQPIA